MLRSVFLRSPWLWACGIVGCGVGLWMGALVSQEPAAVEKPLTIDDINPALRPLLVDADRNPHTRSVMEHFRTGRFPERNSVYPSDTPFDRAAYEQNPAEYLDVIEPGRVWKAAQPGKETPQLEILSEQFVSMRQDESTVLRVKVPPRSPVTFTSLDLGAFENGLTSTNIQADEQGEARAVFFGRPGTYGYVNILAGSPLASSVAHLVVEVRPLEEEPVALTRKP